MSLRIKYSLHVFGDIQSRYLNYILGSLRPKIFQQNLVFDTRSGAIAIELDWSRPNSANFISNSDPRTNSETELIASVGDGDFSGLGLSFVYFPSRRERHRYEMDVREIKEMVMRTASRMEKAEQMLSKVLLEMPRQDDSPYLVIASIPVFWSDFLVDVRNARVREEVSGFGLSNQREYIPPSFNFTGLERRLRLDDNSTVQAQRNGLVVLNFRVRIRAQDARGTHGFFPCSIDLVLRKFVVRAAAVYSASGIAGPYLLSIMLRVRIPLRGIYGGMGPNDEVEAELIPPQDYPFPIMQADDLVEVDRVIRPLCDQAHQLFGRAASPSFDRAGDWTGPED